MLQSTSEYEERNFDDIQRALDIEHTVKALESQLCYFHSHCYIDQSFLAESSGLFLLKTFVHHTSYGCMVWFTNAKQANIRRETYTSQLMKGGHFTMNLPLFISSANFLLMKSLLLVLFRGLCSLLGLTAQQKIN